MLSATDKLMLESAIAKNINFALDRTYAAMSASVLMPRHEPTAKELVESALMLMTKARNEISEDVIVSLLDSVQEKLNAALERMEMD